MGKPCPSPVRTRTVWRPSALPLCSLIVFSGVTDRFWRCRLHVDCISRVSMPPAGTTLARLDRETSRFHVDADRGWRHLLSSKEATRDDYIRQLFVSYGFEAPFEAACAYTPGVSQLIDLRGRARSGLIAQDLLSLGVSPDRLTSAATCDITPFQDGVEALGWMYVVERVTLGFEDIREALMSRFVDLRRATMYLSAYEHTASRRWAELGIAMDRVCTSEPLCHRVCEAATAAFEAKLTWQRSHGPALRSVG
jgi:heme oxygenase